MTEAFDRVVNGKVQERWEHYDGTRMMQQLQLGLG